MAHVRSIRRRSHRAQEERRRSRERYRKYIELSSPSQSDEPPQTRAVYVYLRGNERRELKRTVRSGKSEQRRVLRCRIVLHAASGWGNGRIARELECDEKTVRKWRGRFAALRMIGLLDAPRDGRPPKFTPMQRHQIIAKVLSAPPKPLACWSLTDLADSAVADGIVASISRETIGRWLRTADLKPHRNKYWLNSKDPEFIPKMNRVVELYLNPPEDGMLWCLDEKTGIQALSRPAPTKPTRAGLVKRTEFEYKRNGTAGLLAAFNVKTGHVEGCCFTKDDGGSNNSTTFIAFLEELMERYPEQPHGKLYLIMDNGSSHISKETKDFMSLHTRLVPIYLPTHASWLNQVEIWFGILSRRGLKNLSFSSTRELVGHIQDYIAYHNNYKKHPYKWTMKGQPLTI